MKSIFLFTISFACYLLYAMGSPITDADLQPTFELWQQVQSGNLTQSILTGLLHRGAILDSFKIVQCESQDAPVVVAASTGNLRILLLLLHSNANPNIQDGLALVRATSPRSVLHEHYVAIIRTLLAHGANPHAFGVFVDQPLQQSVILGQTVVVKLLLESSKKHNSRYTSDCLERQIAIALEHGDREIADILQDYLDEI